MELLKVSAKSNPKKVAGAIVGATKEEGKVELQTIGAGAVNQTVKAVAIARNFVKKENVDFICIPQLIDVEIDGNRVTAVQFTVERR